MGSCGRSAALLVSLSFIGLPGEAAGKDPTPGPDRLLAVSDVERETGLRGVRRIASRMAGPRFELNFETNDGKSLLTVMVSDAVSYARWKGRRFRAAVKGVGDESFSGPPGSPRPQAVYFRKGDRSGAVSSALSRGEPRLGAKALERLARLVAARLPER